MNFLTLFIVIGTTYAYTMTTLENPILPISLGNTYVTTQHNTAYYHINTTIILKSIYRLETTLAALYKLTKTLDNKTTWPEHSSILLRTNIETNQIQIKTMQQTIKNLGNNRHKRGLLNFMGTAQKWLFGTLDADDGAKYDSYVQTLKENQGILNENLEKQAHVLKEVTKTFHDQFSKIEAKLLSEKINIIAKENQNLQTMLNFNLILTNINMQSNKIKDLISHIQLAVNFAQLGVMHYTILQHNELNQIINNIPKSQQIPFDNVIKYYETMTTQVKIQNELIIFVIYTPIIDPRPFLLYKLYPIPIQNLTLRIKFPYLLLTTDIYYNTLWECPKVENIYLCTQEVLKQEEQCVYSLVVGGQQKCPFVKVHFEEPTVKQLPNGQLLIIPKRSQTIEAQCDKATHMDILLKPTLVTFESCNIIINNQTFTKVTENFNFELKIPKIDFSNLPQNITVVNLKKVNYNALQEALEEAEKLKVQPFKELHYYVSYFNTYLIIALSTVIIIILILLYLKNLETLEIPQMCKSNCLI